MNALINTTMVPALVNAQLGRSLALVSLVMLLVVVIQKEFSLEVDTEQSRMFSRFLNVVLVPLLVMCTLLIVVGVIEASIGTQFAPPSDIAFP